MTLSNWYTITKIHKKSHSPAFEGAVVGDTFHFFVDMSPSGVGCNGTMAKYITCKNVRTQKESYLSFNQIGRVLKLFEWIEGV